MNQKGTKIGNTRIRITRGGKLFIFLALGTGAAALNTGNNLLYLVFAMELSMILFSGILSSTSLHGLKIKRQIPQEVFAEEPFPIETIITNNKKFFPSISISIKENETLLMTSTAGMRKKAYVLKIPATQSYATLYNGIIKKRGSALLSNIEISTMYPFSLIEKSRLIKTKDEVLVYPHRIPPNRDLIFKTGWKGDFLSGKAGGSENPFGIRDYKEGDPMRSIHWKSTAKTGKLMVKEYEKEKKKKFYLYLYLSKPKNKIEEDRCEKLISMCCGWIHHLGTGGYETNLQINGLNIKNSDGRYLNSYMRSLALLELENLPEKINASIEQGENTSVVFTNTPSSVKGADIVISGEER